MIKDALVNCLENSWKKRLEIFQLEQNIRDIMKEHNLKDVSKELGLIFLEILSNQQNPSEYILNILNSLLSTEVISVNIFFENLIERPQLYKKHVLIRTCLKIYKLFLPNFSGSRKRKRDEENIQYYPPFPQKFLDFYISQGKPDLQLQKEAIEIIEILKQTNNIKAIQDLIDNYPKEKNSLFEVLEKSKSIEFMDVYENDLWISLYVFLIHYLYHSNIEDDESYLLQRLKNLKEFRSGNNQMFLCELYLTLFKLPEDYVSKSFILNRVPQIIQDMGLMEDMNGVFDLLKKFDRMKGVKDGFIYKKIQNIDKRMAYETLKNQKFEGQLEVLDFIIKNLDKDLLILLNQNVELLQIFQINGRSEALLKSFFERMKVVQLFEDSFLLLYNFMILFDVQGRNKEAFMKILQKISFDLFIFDWIRAYLYEGAYAQDLNIFNISDIEKNVKKVNISYPQLLIEVPIIIQKIYDSKRHDLFEKFWKMYGIVAEISSCVELSKYSVICIPSIQYQSRFKIEKLDIDSPKNSFKIEFGYLIEKRTQNLTKFINIFKVMEVEHFIRMLVNELTLFSEETSSIQIAEAAGSLVILTGEKGSDYLLEYIKSMIQRSSNNVSFSQLYSVFINTALSLCPSQKFEEFNIFIKDQLQD